MLVLKYLLMILGVGAFRECGGAGDLRHLLVGAVSRLLRREQLDESSRCGRRCWLLTQRPLRPVRWRLARQLVTIGGRAIAAGG